MNMIGDKWWSIKIFEKFWSENEVRRPILRCFADNALIKSSGKNMGSRHGMKQMNMLFTLLLFIMEYSLREENCTMDEIASFVEDISYGYYGRKLKLWEKSGICKIYGGRVILGKQRFLPCILRPLIMKNGPIRTSISAILTIRSCIWRMASGEPPTIWQTRAITWSSPRWRWKTT